MYIKQSYFNLYSLNAIFYTFKIIMSINILNYNCIDSLTTSSKFFFLKEYKNFIILSVKPLDMLYRNGIQLICIIFLNNYIVLYFSFNSQGIFIIDGARFFICILYLLSLLLNQTTSLSQINLTILTSTNFTRQFLISLLLIYLDIFLSGVDPNLLLKNLAKLAL